MWQLIQRFLHDRRGNIALMGAASMLTVCGFTAFGVDIGSIFLDKRKTQSVADLAAIVAASDPTKAANAAKAALLQNNYPADSSWPSNTGRMLRMRPSRQNSALPSPLDQARRPTRFA